TRWPGDILPNADRATGSSLALCENSAFTRGNSSFGASSFCCAGFFVSEGFSGSKGREFA
ncbi:hypothetical protein AB9E29_33270, partial [Rhizobium leguminosarum]|uniref:hypothetical protein n=1 Tax=Rhizobium leguminosarum TaxID=384 RepID=UPI003F994D94